MRTYVDRFGRVLVPKGIRTSLGMDSGAELEAVATKEGLLLRPAHRKPSLRWKDGVLVFTGDLLPGAERTIQAVREDRIRKLTGLK